ncbi:MAG: tetratricopeptide repeat protein [Proteobacteria bacterium]|nr:tetratricopeptide repeat protein [Pseudomonadota bacterium]
MPYNATRLGELLAADGAKSALDPCLDALARSPEDAGLHHVYGRVLNNLNRLPEALDAINRAVGIESGNPLMYAHRGHILLRLQRMGQAADDFQRALALEPSQVVALGGLASICLAKGRAAEATALLLRLTDCDPDNHRHWLNLGLARHESGLLHEAEESFRTALEHSPGDPDVFCGLASVLQSQGHLDEAGEWFAKALHLQADHPQATAAIAGIRELQGKPDEALAMLRPLLSSESGEVAPAVGWLVGAVRPRPPYPVLVLVSEQGSGKTLAAKCLRSLIDPSAVPLRAMPKDERDLAIASRGNYILAFDNISHIPAWLSDALCRIASGEGWATRRLYTDAEEEVFTFARPVLMTGIDDFVAASDLLDRTQLVGLPSIPPERRRRESELLEAFEALRPSLFGALLDAVAMALRNRHKTWTGLPRMADYASWVMSAEPALPWPQGAFIKSFSDSAALAHEVVLDASLIAEEMRGLALACEPEGWEGTSTELLRELERRVDDTTRRGRSWPKTARALSNQIRRILPALRAINVAVTFHREPRATRRRLIKLVPMQDRVDDLDAVDAGEVDDVDAGSLGVDASETAADAEIESRMDDVDAVDDEFSSLEEWEEEI